MKANQIMGILQNLFPNINNQIAQAQNLIRGVEDSFDGVKSFLQKNNITNAQIDKVANFIQTHPAAKLMGGAPFIVAKQIRSLKSDSFNKDTSIAPDLKLPVQTSTRRTTKI